MDRTSLTLALSLALALPLGSSAAEPDAGRPVLLPLQASLDIDREGRVTQVEFVDKLDIPAAIRQQAHTVASSWQFLPPMKDGKQVSGRTYARVQACVAPVGDGLDVSIAFGGNGPAAFFQPPRKPVAPSMPIATLQREGIERVQGKIAYVVSSDGRAQLESATLIDPTLQKRYGRAWERDQREMMRSFRYLPEMVDGVAIQTRLESLSEQVWVDSIEQVRAQTQEEGERSDACRKLRGEDGARVATDSPFKRNEG